MKAIKISLFTAALMVLMFVGCRQSTVKEAGVLYTFDLRQLADANPTLVRIDPQNTLGRPTVYLSPDAAEAELSLPIENVPWAEARYLVADVYHENRHSDMIWFRFYERADSQHVRIAGKIGLLPSLETRVVLPFSYLDGQTFFMARRPRQMKGTMPGSRMQPEQIGRVTIALEPATKEYQAGVWLSNLRLTTEEPAPLPKEVPIVDQWGQWTERDWPGKIKGEAQLNDRMRGLAESVSAAFPENWSAYGGWKEKRLAATGFFRVQKHEGRWWLVDPEGYLFFSVGMDCANPNAAGPITGMEDLFVWLPDSGSAFDPALQRRGRYRTMNFMAANLIRVFGEEWESRWQQMTRGLLVQCRFNTIGNWSDLKLVKNARLPYVWPLRGFPSTEVRLYRDFPDVFSQQYRDASERFAQQIVDFKGDPYMIGYFLANEPLWAFGDNNIAAEMLATTTSSATRQALVEWLKKQYGNDIARLSAAWRQEFPSFDALLTTAIPDAADSSPAAERDLRQFSLLMVDEYLRLPTQALRRLDPHHLNLGIRYAWISSELCYRGGDYFDVFSINSYSDQPNAQTIAEIARRSGKPVMIGEFHHGAIDRGLPSTGIRGVTSQEERGVAYRYYVEQGAALPDLVGVHYFQLNDQPVLGRFDGENYNIGLVDICNQPYPEMVQATTATNETIYEVAAGSRKPVERKPQVMPAIYF